MDYDLFFRMWRQGATSLCGLDERFTGSIPDSIVKFFVMKPPHERPRASVGIAVWVSEARSTCAHCVRTEGITLRITPSRDCWALPRLYSRGINRFIFTLKLIQRRIKIPRSHVCESSFCQHP